MLQPMGRDTAQGTAAGGTSAAADPLMSRRSGFRLKDMAVAMLPLGIWVTGAVAYERIAPPPAEAILVSPKTAAAVHRMPSLRDERSLLDALPGEPSAGPATAPAGSADRPIRILASHALTLEPGSEGRLPLGIETAGSLPQGAYLIVRGVSLDAALSHGIAIGPDVWLVDGADLGRVALRTKSGASPQSALTLQLVAADGRLLAEDRLLVETQSVKQPEPAMVAAVTVPQLELQGSSPMVIMPRAADEPAQPDLTAVGELRSNSQQTAAAAATLAALTELPKVVETAPPPAPALPAAAPAEPAPRPATPLATSKAIEAALARGRRMLEVGNVAIARPLLERAAASGSAVAALLIGQTYDANWLEDNGSLGVAADAALARKWYAEAERLGSDDVARLMAALPAR